MATPYAVVMAGGSGTRFWPAGRKKTPKQFLSVTPPRTLIQDTIARIPAEIPLSRTLIITNAAHADLAARETGIPPENIIGEPVGKDTAPAIALAATIIEKRAQKSPMIVMAADHVIKPVEAFHNCLRKAIAVATESGCLVTIGVKPTHAATGYGYIELGRDLGGAFEVSTFKEKPKKVVAEEYVASGRYLWNSGIFAWRSDVILAAIKKHAGDLAARMAPLAPAVDTQGFATSLRYVYGGIDKISIDYAVMEHAPNRVCVPADFSWDDVGSFEALSRHNPIDAAGNVVLGRAKMIDTKRTIIDNRTPGVVATIGLDDVIIVRTGDAVLVARRDQAEAVKRLVEEMESSGSFPDVL